jgi:hypothetical protein
MTIFIAAQGCKTKQEQEVDTHHILKANSIKGFLGIKWGEPIDSAKHMLQQRNSAARISSENPYCLSFSNRDTVVIDPSNEIVETIVIDCPFEIVDTRISDLYLRFTSRGFCSASAHFGRMTYDQSTTLYRKLKETLEEKYGQPTKLNRSEFAFWDSQDSCFIGIFNFKRYDDAHEIMLMYVNSVIDRTREAEESEYKNRLEAEEAANKDRIEQQIKEKTMNDL